MGLLRSRRFQIVLLNVSGPSWVCWSGGIGVASLRPPADVNGRGSGLLLSGPVAAEHPPPPKVQPNMSRFAPLYDHKTNNLDRSGSETGARPAKHGSQPAHSTVLGGPEVHSALGASTGRAISFFSQLAADLSDCTVSRISRSGRTLHAAGAAKVPCSMCDQPARWRYTRLCWSVEDDEVVEAVEDRCVHHAADKTGRIRFRRVDEVHRADTREDLGDTGIEARPFEEEVLRPVLRYDEVSVAVRAVLEAQRVLADRRAAASKEVEARAAAARDARAVEFRRRCASVRIVADPRKACKPYVAPPSGRSRCHRNRSLGNRRHHRRGWKNRNIHSRFRNRPTRMRRRAARVHRVLLETVAAEVINPPRPIEEILDEEEDQERPPVTYVFEPSVVGGSSDCWKLILGESPKDDEMLLSELVNTMMSITMMQAEQFGDEETQERWLNWFVENYHIEFQQVAPGRYHVANVDSALPWQTIPLKEGWITYGTFLEMAEAVIAEEERIQAEEAERALVGSDAAAIVSSAMQVHGPDLAKNASQRLFDDDLKSTPALPYRMTTAQLNQFSAYIGSPVVSTQRQSTFNDHLMLQAARHLVREELRKVFPHNQDAVPVLHVGATMTEVKGYWSYPAHDFAFALREDKDNARMHMESAAWLAAQIKAQKLPALKASKAKTLVLEFPSTEDIFRFAEAGDRKRAYVREYPKRTYGALVFQDCLYKMSVKEFEAIWRTSGADVGYAVMFFPDPIITDECAPSDIYDVEKYLPGIPEIADFIRKVWPACTAFTPLIPIDEVMGAFETVWSWCKDQGLAFLGRMWDSWTSGSFPIETILGNAFDVMKVGPIVRQLMEMYWPMLYDRLCRISVTWKNGFAHGYDEKFSDWKRWLRPRHRFDDFCVDMEVQARFGEMYLLKFHRSTGASPIVTKLALPKGRQIVMVADIEASYDRKVGVISDIKYFPVLAQHWYKILNWCLDQPPDSLSFAVVMTTLNRIRGGLSLGSRKLVEEMNIEDGDVAKIALAALMEAYNRHAVIDIIENDPEMRASYETHLATFLKKAAAFGLTIATGGLAVPAYFVFRWLWAQDRVIEFVKYPSPPKIIREPGRKTDEKPVDRPIRVVLPTGSDDKPAVSSGCFLCDMQRQGHFSADYDAAHGQAFHVRCHNSDRYSFKFSSAEVVVLRNLIMDAEISHGAAKVTEHIRSLKKYVDAHEDGMEYSFELDYIMGGPGTGKSVVLRKLAKHFEEQNLSVVIESPFNALLSDYAACDVLGYPGKHTFNANTTWYTTQVGTADVLIVDEVTAVDWDLVCAKSKYLGVKRVIIAGDHAQTGLRPETGEGTNIFDRLGSAASDIRTHELVYNYRMDAWRVRLHNKLWGYRMIPKRVDMLPPKVITLAEYRALQFDKAAHREMVFAHASAEAIFGVTSQAGPTTPGIVNMSVRSSQGRTSTTAAVALLDRDRNMAADSALLNVANSRATHQVYYVVAESVSDPVALDLKARLHIDTQEAIDNIANRPLPDPPGTSDAPPLDPDQAFMQAMLRKYTRHGSMWADGERVYLEPDDEELPAQAPNAPDNWVWGQFETCLLDPVREAHPELELEMRAYLLALWADDGAMGREGLAGRLCRAVKTGNRALSKSTSGKYLLPVTDTMKWLDSINVAVALYREGAPTPAYITQQCRRTGVEIVLALKDNHVEKARPKSVSVETYGMVTQRSPLDLVGPGRLVLDLPKNGSSYVLAKGVAPVASDPLASEVVRQRANKAAEDIRQAAAEALARVPGADNLAWTGAPSMGPTPPAPKVDRPAKPFVHVDPTERRLATIRTTSVGDPPKTILPPPPRALAAAPSTAARAGDVALDDLGDAGGFGWTVAPQRMKLVPNVEFTDALHRFESTCRAPITSAYMLDPTGPQIEEPRTETKLRLGTDAYRLADFIDPSAACLDSRLNYDAGFAGVEEDLNIDVNVDGLLWRRTKAGKPVPHARRKWRQIHPGLGNHFTDHPVENIQATKRYSDANRPAKRRTAESDAWCRRIVDDAFRAHYRNEYALPEQERNHVVFGALSAARQRNYWKRGLAARAKWAGRNLVFSGKSQFKPEKNGRLDLSKAGQGLMQSPPDFNNEWIGWARCHNFMLKDAAKDNWLTDNRESEGTFRTKVTAGIQALPGHPSIGMVDAKTFDALQSQVTVYIESLGWQKLGASADEVAEFQDIRKPAQYMAPGQFKGKHTGQKGSGFLDTLSGNTMLEMVLVDKLFKGTGPFLDAGKGDDFVRVQNGLSVNKPHRADIRAYTAIEFQVDVGYGGEFIGCTVSRDGMYPSITRTAIKTMAARIRDAKHLAEYQASLRDKVLEWRRTGLEETVAASAEAENKSRAYVEACLAFVESFSHISYEQFEGISKTVHEIPFSLPSVSKDRAPTFL